MVMEEGDEVEEVCVVEGTVSEAEESLQVGRLVAGDELEGGVIHAAQQFMGLREDGGPVPPGEDGREESRYLDVLTSGEAVRYRDRVAFEESGPVVGIHAPVEEGLEGGG
jgi:hypothetical protein